MRLYLVDGAVHLNLGHATLDLDFLAQAEDPEVLADFERAIRRLKEGLDVDVEPVSPADTLST